MGCLLARALGHLKRIRNLASQQQCADFCVSDVEPHVRSVESASRDGVSRVRGGHGFSGAPRIRRYLGECPGYLGPDDGQVIQRKVFRSLHRRIRLVHRKPVHREECVDIGAGLRWCDARRLVDEFLRARRIPERPQCVAGPQERQSGAVACRSTGWQEFPRAPPPLPRRGPTTTTHARERSSAPVPLRRGLPPPRVGRQGAGPPARRRRALR